MSELSYLEKLLDGAEVEWKALGDVTTVLRGKRLTKNLLSAEEKFPVFHGGLEPLGYYNKSNRPANTVMIINVGASAGTVGYTNVDFWSSDGCFCLEHNELLNNRFLYFALIGYQGLLKSKVRVAGIPTLDAIVVNKLLIPIPCPDNHEKSLAIQAEIVRILDTFTELTAELTAELTMRKKQYNYYRDQLLRFEEGETELKALDDVCTLISAGGDVPKNSVKGQVKPTNEYPYPIYANATDEKGLYGYTDSYKIDSDAVTISARGAKVGYHTVRDAKFTPIIRLIVLVADKNLVRTRYLNYVLDMTDIGGTDGGIPQLTVPMVKKITVPIPFASDPNRSLAEQDRIIAILDKFEVLTNSISEGLPREIELRQKQYEYYRDLLLSFPKTNAQEVA
ncbi:TPA: restriction endonuclease subunit S [Klebsiella pneumoniae]|uniref:restriction endonuclease subunit S n=1 Tax=Klebsiella pneumoniae complex TaxID=3390273 RepID=UPI0020CEFFB8|nr:MULTISPECIES: restriction endonuclease subunit S [Klebsiella]MCQ0645748.1 restriction endonuclease subunit S [Klebsiella pneumoniae]MDV0461321.1 restriction endonuclease subunit S [Klebsiella quasipneumoniae subsp. similipneumoniae]MDV0823374.1 restriction endonuclease subunit S [Klebsiella quasipneumoniae subsp. similipneumoniae]MDV0864615.1 restriction endonuclease subunit S [Klebsiella quasipneumoniae subsp. similipneumoniae]HBR6904975.1 restriction endonuclease subunit S [Klebsiella pne